MEQLGWEDSKKEVIPFPTSSKGNQFTAMCNHVLKTVSVSSAESGKHNDKFLKGLSELQRSKSEIVQSKFLESVMNSRIR